MGRVRRWLHRIAWLLKSLFLNLTPARRVLLALALLLLCVRAQGRGDGQSLQIDFGGLPVALLLLLLMLELKDKGTLARRCLARDRETRGLRIGL
jgi:hypothetical protein